jgi:hypothetical protein
MTTNPKLAALGQRLRFLKDRKDYLEEELKEVNKEAKELQERTIPKVMEDAEIEKATIEGAGTMYIKQVVFASLIKDESDEPPFYDWARSNAPDLIKPFIHPKRLQSWAKERLEGGEPLPNSINAVFVPTATLLRK